MFLELLAPPTWSLKEATIYDEWSTIRAAVQLFDPAVDVDTRTLDRIVRVTESLGATHHDWTRKRLRMGVVDYLRRPITALRPVRDPNIFGNG